MGVTDKQRKDGLLTHRVKLIDDLDLLDSGLLDEMIKASILNKRQAAAIKGRGEGEKDAFKANTRLTDDILSKCDLQKYNKFLDLLQKENSDLADLLRGKQEATPRAPAAAVAAANDDKGIELSDAPITEPDHVDREKYDEIRKKGLMYQMDREPRGLALIINIQHSRSGTDVDRDNLQNLWRDFMHFQVTTYNDEDDLTAQGIVSKVEAFSSDSEMKKSQAIVVCLLAHGKDTPRPEDVIHGQGTHETHGQEGYIQGTDRILVPLKQIYSYFNNENKNIQPNVPRLFFIQACRGDAVDLGVGQDRTDDCSAEDEDDEDDAGVTVTDAIMQLPTLTDFFWGYATPNGAFAFRNTMKGSWYITALVQTFYKYAHKLDIGAMHNLVNNAVAERKANCPRNKMDGAKTISESKSTLTKAQLYFFP